MAPEKKLAGAYPEHQKRIQVIDGPYPMVKVQINRGIMPITHFGIPCATIDEAITLCDSLRRFTDTLIKEIIDAAEESLDHALAVKLPQILRANR